MSDFKEMASKLAKNLFGKSEFQNRVATNAVKMIIGDINTLNEEFRKVKGIGALFFNPTVPDASNYMTVADIQTDIALAEEIMNDDLASFLKELLGIVEKEAEENAVVVMVSQKGMSVHVVNLEAASELIDKTKDATRFY